MADHPEVRIRTVERVWRVISGVLAVALVVAGAMLLATGVMDGVILFSGGSATTVPPALLFAVFTIALLVGIGVPLSLALTGQRRTMWRRWIVISAAGVWIVALVVATLEVMLLAGVFKGA